MECEDAVTARSQPKVTSKLDWTGGKTIGFGPCCSVNNLRQIKWFWTTCESDPEKNWFSAYFAVHTVRTLFSFCNASLNISIKVINHVWFMTYLLNGNERQKKKKTLQIKSGWCLHINGFDPALLSVFTSALSHCNPRLFQAADVDTRRETQWMHDGGLTGPGPTRCTELTASQSGGPVLPSTNRWREHLEGGIRTWCETEQCNSDSVVTDNNYRIINNS